MKNARKGCNLHPFLYGFSYAESLTYWHASPEMQERLCDEDDDAIEVNMLRDSLVRCIEVVGQCLHNAQTADPSFEARHALNASGWWGMRSKISHGYDVVQYETSWL